MDATTHLYRTALLWSGSTAVGFDHYDRTHRVTADGSPTELTLSADPSFRGDPTLLNPEQLLVAAASSCQMLTFLAVAAKSRLDVISYLDEAVAVMPGDDRPVRITRIDLHPTVTLVDHGSERPDAERLDHLTEVAHRACFIANSLRSEVTVHPTFVWVEGDD